MKKLVSVIIPLAAVFTALFLVQAATAAPAPAPPNNATGQALEIAPPVVTLKADPGQTITTQISIRGVSSSRLLVTGEINDFTAAGEDGTPKILMDEEEEESPFSLRGWVSPLPQLTLEPRQIKNMTVTIRVPANAAPGGYYGVVRFTATPPELKDTGVSLSASLGSLLLVRVNGEAKEKLKIEEFSANTGGPAGWFFESGPISFVERLKNEGNTHLEPAGQITITDMFGKTVANVNVNLPPRNVLPASIRKFEQRLDSSTIGNMMLFGKYQADLKLTYGDSKQVVTASITFWVVPWKLITLAVVGLIVAFFLLRFLIRRYNRRIISRSRGGGLNMRRRR
jgi:hypothetical protein